MRASRQSRCRHHVVHVIHAQPRCSRDSKPWVPRSRASGSQRWSAPAWAACSAGSTVVMATSMAWSAALGGSPRRWRLEVARPPRSVLAMAGDRDDDEAAHARALVRYRLIAEATTAPRGARTQLLRLAASKEVAWPDGSAVCVSVRTLQRWLARFERGGLAALIRRPRKDKGRVRAISEAALARVITLRKEEPARSTPTLIDIVERADEVAKGALRRSTLDRHLDRRAASRRMLHVLGAKRHIKLAFSHPLDFVVGDFHQGPYVRDVHDEIRRAVLGAFIDHCSRFVPESRYGLAEDQMHVRRGLRALCTSVGPPHKLYVDGGPGYQGARFEFGCSQLHIEIAHSAPYVSEGRGVIERFNRTVKEAFEIEVRLRPEPPTLDELNAFWWAWLDERYHRQVHSELGEPPLERWQRLLDTTQVRRVDPELVDEMLRLQATRTVHAKTSTVEEHEHAG